jgi:DNA primase
MCHNPACSANAGGNIIKLVMLLSNKSEAQTRRFILSTKFVSSKPLYDQVAAMAEPNDVQEVDASNLNVFIQKFQESTRAKEYMESRGLSETTCEYFKVGYDPKSDMVLVPVFDRNDKLVGYNGRSIVGKRFKLSKSLPRNEILFNLNNAKRIGGTAIIAESQFDVMKIHQSGFPNGICSFGSHISDNHIRLIQRYFDRIIIMTDADPAGRKAGHNIANSVRGVHVEWAIHDWGVVYPDGAKDAGDLTEAQIKHCIKNAVSDAAYRSYKSLARSV